MTIVVVEEEECEDENQVLTGKFSEGISKDLHSSNCQHKSCSTAREKINVHVYMFLMRDEKEERKKQARSNKQTRQSNTEHPRQSLFLEKMSCLRWDSNPRHSIL